MSDPKISELLKYAFGNGTKPKDESEESNKLHREAAIHITAIIHLLRNELGVSDDAIQTAISDSRQRMEAKESEAKSAASASKPT